MIKCSRNRFCYHWELFGVFILDCKATRCVAGWTAILWCQHCCDILLLSILHNIRRVCLFLAQEVALLLVEALVISRLEPLQLTPGWCASMCLSNLGSSSRMLQPGWSSTHLSSPTLHSSSTPCTTHRWVLESHWKQWWLPTLMCMAQVHPTSRNTSSPSATLCHCQSICQSLSTIGAQLLLNKILTVCCPGSTMVVQALHWHQDSRNSAYLLCSYVQTTLLP